MQLPAQRIHADPLIRLTTYCADLRATSRKVAAEIRRQQQRLRRESCRGELRLPKQHLLVVHAIARQTETPLPPCLTYVLQHTACGRLPESDQPRAERISHMLQDLLADSAQSGAVLDADPDDRTPASKRAWKRASEHLADMDLAEWTVGCNVQQHCAPTTAQLRAKRRACQLRYNCPVLADDHDAKAVRRFSRAIRRWRRMWGFRYGKLRIQDRFADGELRAKAPRRLLCPPATCFVEGNAAHISGAVFGTRCGAVLS